MSRILESSLFLSLLMPLFLGGKFLVLMKIKNSPFSRGKKRRRRRKIQYCTTPYQIRFCFVRFLMDFYLFFYFFQFGKIPDGGVFQMLFIGIYLY